MGRRLSSSPATRPSRRLRPPCPWTSPIRSRRRLAHDVAGRPRGLDRPDRRAPGHHHRGAGGRAVRHARSRRSRARHRHAAAAALALALLPADGTPERARSRRPCPARRLPATGAAAAPDVGRQPARIRPPAARRRRGPAHVADRRRDEQERALRAARLRHRRARDRQRRRRRDPRGARHRLPRAARPGRTGGRAARRRATRLSRARSSPTTCCSFATRRSPSTATASTTTAATSPRSRAIPG